MKVPLILFSGGLDSTLMLQQLLELGDVETLYVRGAQGENKIKKELAARQKIIHKLERITGNRVRNDHVVTISNELFHGGMPDVAWTQPTAWIMAALQVSDGQRHSHLCIGYVSGDCILSRMENITQAWYHIQMFTKQNVIPVYFPLHLKEKWQVLNMIDARVWDDTWVCEMPIKDGRQLVACNKCTPCHDQASYLLNFKRRFGMTYQRHQRKRLVVLGPVPRKPRTTKLTLELTETPDA